MVGFRTIVDDERSRFDERCEALIGNVKRGNVIDWGQTRQVGSRFLRTFVFETEIRKIEFDIEAESDAEIEATKILHLLVDPEAESDPEVGEIIEALEGGEIETCHICGKSLEGLRCYQDEDNNDICHDCWIPF